MIRINLSLDPSSWGSSATLEEAKTLAEILSSVICIECDKHGVDVIVSESNWAGANSCDEGEEEDLLWAEGMLAGPWMELALEMFAAE